MSLIRISASRLKLLKDCSLAFYYQEIQKIPQESHWKTKVGTIAHLVFECMLNPRRINLFKKIILEDNFNINNYPNLYRFVIWQLKKMNIPFSSPEEIGDLLNVAFIGVRSYFVLDNKFNPPLKYFSEKRFNIQVGEATLSGFIDLLLIWSDKAVVIDLKTQATKWTKAELPNNIQAAIYALATYNEFNLIPITDFIMLRHPPTKRTPMNHIQRVEAPSKDALMGLSIYIQHMYKVINQFGLEEAYANPHKSFGFCERVCQYYKPLTYWVICKNDDPTGLYPLFSFLDFDTCKKSCQDGQIILERKHNGCALRWKN